MIERLFTSKTRTKVLGLLLFNQDKEYHLREIARIVRTIPTYVSKELDNLVKINLVIKKKRANLNIYSVNKDCVFLDDLKRIFLKTDYLGELIKQGLKGEGVRYCFIYGSFAQGTESSASDIDLFLVSEIKEDKIIKVIQKVEKATQREINYVLWNEETFEKKASGHHLLKTIKKGKIIMLIGDEDEFKKQIK
jgi:predicted nucleotidyltransferase/predicted transcriptional regulator with HTH domain